MQNSDLTRVSSRQDQNIKSELSSIHFAQITLRDLRELYSRAASSKMVIHLTTIILCNHFQPVHGSQAHGEFACSTRETNRISPEKHQVPGGKGGGEGEKKKPPQKQEGAGRDATASHGSCCRIPKYSHRSASASPSQGQAKAALRPSKGRI